MALQKQAISINFASGLETFTDPNQLSPGQFTALSNAVFLREGQSTYALLSKRNGFGLLTTLPDASSSLITTFSGGLLAVGNDIKAYSPTANLWNSRSPFLPLSLATQSLVQNGNNQIFAYSAQANGLLCTTYLETNSSGTGVTGKYIITDLVTGSPVTPPASIPATSGSVSFGPKVFALNNKFALIFDSTNSSNSHLQYQLIDATNPTTISSVSDFSTDYAPNFPSSFDGVIASNTLFISWAAKSSSSVFTGSINKNFGVSGPKTLCSTYSQSRSISMSVDSTLAAPKVWTTFLTTNVKPFPAGVIWAIPKAAATDTSLNITTSCFDILPSAFGPGGTLGSNSDRTNIATWAENNKLQVIVEDLQPFNTLQSNPTNPLQGGTFYAPASSLSRYEVLGSAASGSSIGANVQIVGGAGLASKPFSIGSTTYFLTEYQSTYQSTYFLISSSGSIFAKLAYGNGLGPTGGNVSLPSLRYGLPSVVTIGTTSAYIPYLFKDSITSVNKGTNVGNVQTAGIFSQTGVGLASFQFSRNGLQALEAGKNINLSGGYLWAYDGQSAAEYGFHIYPDVVQAVVGSGSAIVASGAMSPQTYYYQAIYSWVDNQGNIFQSSPSIPVSLTLSSGSSFAFVSVQILNETGKLTNPSIDVYRWSAAQPIYYKVLSLPNGLTGALGQVPGYPGQGIFTDIYSDAQIIGNQILYTNGGVVENASPPACLSMTEFDSRMWVISAENRNLLWYSKQILEATPVEFSDLFTFYVPATTAANLSTGPVTCLAPMDDKLIIFKNNSLYYINGTGPDNTGANSQYSPPILITNGVGCSNQSSIVLVPRGLMFKSNKGIWLLGRDLTVDFIGRPVEIYNSANVLSADLIPGTNQVRFSLDTGIMLMYDYFVNQWGTFSAGGISSIVYNNLQAYLDSSGNVFQEAPNVYSDGSTAVVMSFTTGWISMAGLQGYKRLYRMYMLGNYKAPHSLNGQIAYDYNSAITQSFVINPTNTTSSGSQVEQWQINFQQQQCQSFQLTMTEVSSVSAGQGLTISGLRIVAGIKSEQPRNVGVKTTTS